MTKFIISVFLIFSSYLLLAQEDKFKVTLATDFQSVSNSSNWESYDLSVGYAWSMTEISLKGGLAKRFDLWDNSLGLNGIFKLNEKMYVNSELQVSKGVFLPNFQGNVNYFLSIGKFVLSTGYKYFNFNNNVHQGNLGIAKYWGSELTTVRTYFTKADFNENILWSVLFSHRHYFTDDAYLNALFASGKEASANTEDLRVINFTNRTFGIQFSQKLKKLSFLIGLSYINESFENKERNRIGLSLIISN